MMKRQSILISAIFCLFLGGFLLAFLLLPSRAFSETENRVLAQWPRFSTADFLSGKYGQSLEHYLSDQFPLRDEWMALQSGASFAAGFREFNGVYLCGDTLISKVDEPDAALVEKNLQYLQALSDRTDLPVYFAPIPTAAEIWRDKLPAGATSYDEAAFCGSLSSRLEKITVVDLLSALRAHSSEPLYYRTDHHWTTMGAYYGYAALMEAMGITPVPLEHYTPTTVTEDFQGTLYSSSGVHWLKPDSIELYVPDDGITVLSNFSGTPEPGSLYVEDYLAVKDKYSMFLGGNQPFCEIHNENADGGKLLIVRDSYMDSEVPFLTQHFSDIYLMDLRYYRASVAEIAAQYDVDAIVVSYGVSNFLKDDNLIFLGR